ncbi:alpha/beta fold hydrolase [Saccharopolyspora mangrovi]|uniref:Alpha/beta fold hydrolase n=1 Tax=Saccharopolyspora mangrovi TaxID=3082379 RepID=A0ABU6A9U9_9PSEU|nr:alpha/beta fold hydrolase [Saccharopolyspora sp. S2-29]MEB3368285.1 alpha/beta fold hydrolase [Saccharopolyspora sp. S2-29]
MTAPPQGVEVDQIEFPAGKVRYYTAGTHGPPVVLLHGGGPDNALLSWRNTIGVLAADHRVYAPDLPGQGGSTEWRGRANQRTFEEVLRWLLDAWQIPQATLVGLSMGGSIAVGFTLRHPQRVRALALVDSTGLQHRMPHHLLTYLLMRTNLSGRMAAKLLRGNRALVRLALNKVFFADASAVSDLESIVGEVSAEAAARRSVFADWHADAINRRSMSINHLPQLDRIACPVTVIHGEKDALVPVASAHEVAGAIPGAQLRVMPQAGHWPNRERPTEFNALLREFVNALNAPPAPVKGTTGAPQRDGSTEAPTQRMKVPTPGPAADSTASKEQAKPGEGESTDSATQLMKVGAATSTEGTDADGTEESSTKDSSGAPDTPEDADTAEKDTADAAGTPAADDESGDAGSGEKKATTDAPTRFIKVGSTPEGEPKAETEPEQGAEEKSVEKTDEKSEENSEEAPEEKSEKTSEESGDTEEPTDDAPEDSDGKPVT